MYRHIEFKNGSNPYVSFTDDNFIKIVLNEDLQFLNAACFFISEPAEYCRKTYQNYKNALRDFAIEFQNSFSFINYSYAELAEWQNFFEKYGKKYGLIREFKENGIL